MIEELNREIEQAPDSKYKQILIILRKIDVVRKALFSTTLEDKIHDSKEITKSIILRIGNLSEVDKVARNNAIAEIKQDFIVNNEKTINLCNTHIKNLTFHRETINSYMNQILEIERDLGNVTDVNEVFIDELLYKITEKEMHRDLLINAHAGILLKLTSLEIY